MRWNASLRLMPSSATRRSTSSKISVPTVPRPPSASVIRAPFRRLTNPCSRGIYVDDAYYTSFGGAAFNVTYRRHTACVSIRGHALLGGREEQRHGRREPMEEGTAAHGADLAVAEHGPEGRIGKLLTNACGVMGGDLEHVRPASVAREDEPAGGRKGGPLC